MKRIDLGLHYNYVYFNTNYLGRGILDRNEYNAICLRDAEQLVDVTVIQSPLQDYPKFLRKLYFIYNAPRINRYIKLPFKRLWFPLIFKASKYKNDKPFCFIHADNAIPLAYCISLKKKYPDCKLVKVHRDLLKFSHLNPEHSEDNLNRIFDLRFAYDPNDAAQYNILHFDEIESKIDIKVDADYPLSDVYFAGQAKDRLTKIIEAYDLFTSKGLKCDFFIAKVPKDHQIERDGITYSDTFIPYIEMLYKSVNSKCMFDVNQGGAVGYTSRFLEAIMYNKLFITDNPAVKNTDYFKTGNIQYYENIQDIDLTFIDNRSVDYNYNGEFSPIHLIKRIDQELLNRL